MAIEAIKWAWAQPVKPGVKLVLLALADAANKDTGICWPGYKELSQKCGLDKATIVQHVKSLCEFGLISKKHTSDNKGYRRNNSYTVHFSQIEEIQTGISQIEKNQSRENSSPICVLSSSNVVNANGNNINPHITKTEPLNKNLSALAEEVFDYWKLKLNHPNAKLDNKRKTKILAAIKQYSVEELKQAIDGCSKSAFHLGQNDRGQKYDGVGLILRDAEQIEKFISLSQPALPHSLPGSHIMGVE